MEKEIGTHNLKIGDKSLTEEDLSAFINDMAERNNAIAEKIEHLDSLVNSLTHRFDDIAQKFNTSPGTSTNEVDRQQQSADINVNMLPASESRSTFVEKKAESVNEAKDIADTKTRLRADEIIAEAEYKADRLARQKIRVAELKEEQARAEAERILSESERKAHRCAQEKIEAAERQAKSIIKEAEDRADTIKITADQKSTKILFDAQQKLFESECRAQDILRNAEEKANEIKFSANREANKIAGEARLNAELTEEQTKEIMREAERKSEVVRSTAQKDAARLIEEARDRADREARSEINRIISETRMKAEKTVEDKILAAEQKAQDILREAEGKALGIKYLAEKEADAAIVRAKEERGGKTKEELDALTVEAERRAQQIIREKTDSISALAQQEANRIIKEAKERTEKAVLVFQNDLEQLFKKKNKIGSGDLKELLHTFTQNLSFTSDPPPSININTTDNTAKLQPDPLKMAQPEQPGQDGNEQVVNKDPDAYQGAVEIAIPPPISLDRMLQLHKHLKETSNIEVVNLGGSVDKGIIIKLVLDNPTPILKVLSGLPEVKSASDNTASNDNAAPSPQLPDDEPVKRIQVITKE